MHQASDIEAFHTKFLRLMLGVKKNQRTYPHYMARLAGFRI